MNNEVTGFIVQELNTTRMFKYILGLAIKKEEKKKTVNSLRKSMEI